MISLLIVDSQEIVCQGLKAMLNLEPNLEVVGVANNGQTAIKQVAALKPDVVLMEMQIPIIDGQEATRIITQQFPHTKVLILSTFDDNRLISDSMRAGANGYLLKDMPYEELAQAILFVHRGYTQLAPGLMRKLIKSIPENETVGAAESFPQELAQLTPREQEVLNWISKGNTNREIAQKLYIAEGTVKTHVTRILNRLNLRNRAELAIYANSASRYKILEVRQKETCIN